MGVKQTERFRINIKICIELLKILVDVGVLLHSHFSRTRAFLTFTVPTHIKTALKVTCVATGDCRAIDSLQSITSQYSIVTLSPFEAIFHFRTFFLQKNRFYHSEFVSTEGVTITDQNDAIVSYFGRIFIILTVEMFV